MLFLQLKNMISAIHSSRQVGPKRFEFDAVIFGWGAITAIFTADKERAAKLLPRRVPKLKRSYVERDAWTKLNVRPAKIMQVRPPQWCIFFNAVKAGQKA